MPTRLRRWFDDYDVLGWDEESEVDPEPLDDLWAARQFLRGSLGDHDDMRELRRLYYRDDPIGSRFVSDHELIDRLARRVAQGDLQIVRHFRHEIPWPSTVEQAEPPSPRPQETTWIEIVLVDEYDQPVPGASYQLRRVSEEEAKAGGLDQEGFARVDGLKPAGYQVTFPELDPDLWEQES